MTIDGSLALLSGYDNFRDRAIYLAMADSSTSTSSLRKMREVAEALGELATAISMACAAFQVNGLHRSVSDEACLLIRDFAGSVDRYRREEVCRYVALALTRHGGGAQLEAIRALLCYHGPPVADTFSYLGVCREIVRSEKSKAGVDIINRMASMSNIAHTEILVEGFVASCELLETGSQAVEVEIDAALYIRGSLEQSRFAFVHERLGSTLIEDLHTRLQQILCDNKICPTKVLTLIIFVRTWVPSLPFCDAAVKRIIRLMGSRDHVLPATAALAHACESPGLKSIKGVRSDHMARALASSFGASDDASHRKAWVTIVVWMMRYDRISKILKEEGIYDLVDAANS